MLPTVVLKELPQIELALHLQPVRRRHGSVGAPVDDGCIVAAGGDAEGHYYILSQQ